MIELVAAVISLALIFFLVAQIRFIRRFYYRRKNKVNFPSVLFLSDLVSGCCVCMECFGVGLCHFTDSSGNPRTSNTNIRRDTVITEQNTGLGIHTTEQLRETVYDLLEGTQRLSLHWLSTMSMLPIESVAEILSDDLRFLIKDDFVYKQKINVKSSSELGRKKVNVAKGICPVCSSSIKFSAKFCPTCGFEL